jgi:hypothetical protein
LVLTLILHYFDSQTCIGFTMSTEFVSVFRSDDPQREFNAPVQHTCTNLCPAHALSNQDELIPLRIQATCAGYDGF